MIAIIMAVYNGETYLSQQLDSILHNTCQDFVLHIFDDVSTDQSPQILEHYQTMYPEKIFYHRNTQNRGVICNFLEGCHKIEADYYMFSDQDDVWLPHKIEHTLAKIKEAETNDPHLPLAVFGDATVVDEHLQTLHPSFQAMSGYHTDAVDLPHILMENKLIGCTVMFNGALKQKLNSFPDAIRMHDWWIALIAASMGHILYLDEPLLLYRQHTGNVIGGISKKAYIKNRIAHLSAQRKALYDTCKQADAFLQQYGTQLHEKEKKIVLQFATIPHCNWLVRRYRIVRYHYCKSGLLRNIGIFLVI